MVEVIGVSFKDKGRIYYFSPGKLKLKKNITVVVETERGVQFGKVVTDIIEIDEKKLNAPLKKIVRIATRQDYENYKKNIKDAEKAVKKCKELVNKHKLDMQIIDASYTLDRDQLVFHFIADNRIDFRVLAKDLASIYKTRIELRQVGVRDKAKEIGGFGPCGRRFCCASFLNDFDSVSINMAKKQNLSLNPTKINGVCGRLLCCLNYEDETYKDCRKCLPDIGDKVKVDGKTGTVISLDILAKSYTVDIPDVGRVKVDKECK